MIEPKSVEITDQSGGVKTFTLSKFTAIAGREIISKYPVSNMPKLGDYQVSEETMLKLMSFVAVDTDTGPLQLTTKALIENHVPDWEVLMKIELKMMEYNCSFFANGKTSSFFEMLAQKAQPLITSILTDLSAQSSQAEKPRSKS